MCRNKNKYLIDKVDRLVLPDNLKPKNYDIHLNCNTKEFKYDGQVIIKVDILKSTNVVVLHSIDIEIQSVDIQQQTSKSIEYDEQDEIAIITFENQLNQCEDVLLKIQFTGIINDKLKGFYRSKYTDINNEEHWIYSTQFEAPDARRAFPCFDEPSLKSTFNLKLTIDKDLQAISNMMESEIKINDDNQTKTYTFEQTPIMSTYLLAFVIGDLEYIETYSKIDKTRVRVYKGKGVKDSGEYALEVATKALDFFVEYFGISYPLKKVDHVAIPSFAFYAMENWGCITYHDIYLLTSEKTTLVNKREMVDMIGHELSHQWFGNLVTMEWWSNLWLNEGFASFMGYLVADNLHPEWKMFKEWAQNHRNKALYLDSLTNTHPIEVPVYSTSQIQEIFDDISYNKGGCILQMLENILGRESFRKAINQYLNKHAYRNTVTEDLWESLSMFTNKSDNLNDVAKFINSYTKDSGYPVITIEETEIDGQFKLTQKRFTYNNNGGDGLDDDKQLWNCFIRFKTENQEFNFTLDSKTKLFTVPSSTTTTTTFKRGDWIKPNYGQTGYFRIDYSENILKSLIPKIKSMELSAIDRLGILSDVFNVCKTGSKQISIYMDLLFEAFSDETDSDVWSYIVQTIQEIENIIYDQDYKFKFNEKISSLLSKVSLKLGFDPIENEDPDKTMLRNIINTKLVLLGGNDNNNIIVEECKKRYQSFKIDKSSINTNIVKLILTSVLYNGGDNSASIQNELIQQYLSTNDIAEKKQYLQTLSYGSPTLELYNNILKFSVESNQSVESCNIHFLWNTSNPEFKQFAWKFFCDNFKKIDEIFKDNIIYQLLLNEIFSPRLSQLEINEINQFFKLNPVPIGNLTIKQELEKSLNNYNWFKSINFNLSQFLNK